jgi:hypothetical protein
MQNKIIYYNIWKLKAIANQKIQQRKNQIK